MSDILIVAIFEVKVSNTPHSKSLLILKAGYMYSAVSLPTMCYCDI